MFWCRDGSGSTFSVVVEVAQDFPITAHDLLRLLDMAPPGNARVRQLKDVLSARLPRGFPLRICVPLFFTTSFVVTFTSAQFGGVDGSSFAIPASYGIKK